VDYYFSFDVYFHLCTFYTLDQPATKCVARTARLVDTGLGHIGYQRLIFQEGLAAALQPTLLLLAGPFALLYANYEQITGKQDLIADFFFYTSIFLLLLLGRKLVFLLRAALRRENGYRLATIELQ